MDILYIQDIHVSDTYTTIINVQSTDWDGGGIYLTK
jgi:hypothetical protein